MLASDEREKVAKPFVRLDSGASYILFEGYIVSLGM